MKRLLLLFIVVQFSTFAVKAQTSKPLTLVQTIKLPDVPVGPFTDHLGIDIKGHRLFTTMQAQKAVVVIDLDTGKVIHNIPVVNPHAVAYRSDLNQVYVSDGDKADPGVKVFGGRDYRLIKSVRLLQRTDSMGYDPATKYLYEVNGGISAGLNYSLLSVIDTTSGAHTGDIKVSSGTLEDMDIDPGESRLYIAVTDKNQVAVVDLRKRAVLAMWPITMGRKPVATAIDDAHHRLFVACRTTDLHGAIVVFDSQTGKEIKSLPLGGWCDYLVYDQQSRRIYAVCGVGCIYVYGQLSPDQYNLLQKTETLLMTKTGLLVPELNRFYAAVPNLGNFFEPAEILVYRIQ